MSRSIEHVAAEVRVHAADGDCACDLSVDVQAVAAYVEAVAPLIETLRVARNVLVDHLAHGTAGEGARSGVGHALTALLVTEDTLRGGE